MPRSRFQPALFASACLAVVALVGWRAGAESGESRSLAAPTSIAIVNVENALNSLDELAELNRRLEERVKERQGDLDALRKQMEEVQGRLDELPANAMEQRRELRAQMYELRETATARTNAYQSLINIEKGEIIRPLYIKLGDAVKEVAEKQGYELVLFDDRGIEIPADTDRNVNAAIQQKRIVYASDKLDITEQVVLLLNNKFKTGVK